MKNILLGLWDMIVEFWNLIKNPLGYFIGFIMVISGIRLGVNNITTFKGLLIATCVVGLALIFMMIATVQLRSGRYTMSGYWKSGTRGEHIPFLEQKLLQTGIILALIISGVVVFKIPLIWHTITNLK